MADIPTDKTIVTVCVPTHDMVSAFWAFDYAMMMVTTQALLGDRIALRPLMMTNTYISQARQDLVNEALERGSHYVLFIDADMRFPPDALIRLLAREKEVVGVNYSTRSKTPQFVAIKQREVIYQDARANRCPTLPESTGVEKVHALGGGFLLIKAGAFQKIEAPYFQLTVNEDGTVLGEDVFFCRKLEDAGIDVWVDHDLSKLISHVGSFEYNTSYAAETWLMMEEANGSGLIREPADGGSGASE